MLELVTIRLDDDHDDDIDDDAAIGIESFPQNCLKLKYEAYFQKGPWWYSNQDRNISLHVLHTGNIYT